MKRIVVSTSQRLRTARLLAGFAFTLPVAFTGCGNDGTAAGDPADENVPRSTASIPIKSSTTKPGVTWTPPKSTDRQEERDEMVAKVRDYYGITDKGVLEALSAAPRHEFVDLKVSPEAYHDSPKPIAYGQLISQPFIVAKMTMELQLKPTSRVLEIGTGSAYQAAILSYFTEHVYSIEIIKPLADDAGARLTKLGYDCVQTRCGDGFNGWPEAAPFDAIIVTCAAGQIPPPLIKQLAPGGRMMIPVGPPFANQSLMLVEKDADGSVRSRSLENVRFVPLLPKDPTANVK